MQGPPTDYDFSSDKQETVQEVAQQPADNTDTLYGEFLLPVRGRRAHGAVRLTSFPSQ